MRIGLLGSFDWCCFWTMHYPNWVHHLSDPSTCAAHRLNCQSWNLSSSKTNGHSGWEWDLLIYHWEVGVDHALPNMKQDQAPTEGNQFVPTHGAYSSVTVYYLWEKASLDPIHPIFCSFWLDVDHQRPACKNRDESKPQFHTQVIITVHCYFGDGKL